MSLQANLRGMAQGTLRTSRQAKSSAGFSRAPEASMLDIHRLRRAAAASQAEVSKFAGVSRTRLSFAEQGTVELTQDELLRVIQAICEVPQRRAGRIREVLASLGADLRTSGAKPRTGPGLTSASATAAKGISRSCETYGYKLVEHLIQRKYPVYPREVVVAMAADAVEQEAKAGGITEAEAYAKILRAQKLYLKSRAGKQACILARKWYTERRYLDDPESWKSVKEL